MIGRYIIAALVAALVVLGGLYWHASGSLQDAKASLAVFVEANERNRATIDRMERAEESKDRIVSRWNEDRNALADMRGVARQAIKEAMKDEMYKLWASGAVPASAWRMLRENGGASRNGTSPAPIGFDAGVSGNACSTERK